jgi:hypothetical protein
MYLPGECAPVSKSHIHFMNLGAFFAAPIWKRRKKPGYPLVSFARHSVTGQKDTASIPCAFRIRNRFLRGKTRAFISGRTLAVCCASHVKPQKIADQPIFYPANSVRTRGTRSPIIGDFLRHQAQKIHKRDRLLVD